MRIYAGRGRRIDGEERVVAEGKQTRKRTRCSKVKIEEQRYLCSRWKTESGPDMGCGAPRMADSDGLLESCWPGRWGHAFVSDLRKEYGRTTREQQSGLDRRELLQRGGE